MTEVVRNVEQAAMGTQSVAQSIVQVAHAAASTGDMAEIMRGAATSLSEQNQGLRRSVETFLSGVKAA